jgi:hypothetical protein
MALPVFGSKKKGKPAEAVTAFPEEDRTPPPAPGMPEPLEFDEVPGAPAAASPPESETVPAAVGAAKALRAVRARAPARKAAPKRKGKLTPKQLAQRKYAARMRTVRKRAKKASGGKGRIAKRSGATKLRRKLGLKAGKGTRKAARKKR